MKKIAVVLFSLSVGLGCATSSRLNNISLGMTKKEVINEMGKPTSTAANGSKEYLNYSLPESYGGFPSPYYVRLEKGRVDAYGRLGDFNSTKPDERTVNLNVKSAGAE